MLAKDWLVTNEGYYEARPSTREWDLIRENYYFHQFLTDVIDILAQVNDSREEWDYLPFLRMRVRQLVMNSYWIRTRHAQPNDQTGVGILPLYDEIGYPLTVQIETYLPGATSTIHNHGTWGIVAVIHGREEHTFWRRTPDFRHPDRIEPVGKKMLGAGEILSFMPEAIHQVQAIASEPTTTFCLYGDPQPRSRFRFDPMAHTAKQF
jgi:predicted metal-dependent enzyme (double-stranded beta helix superfamily)